MTRGLPRRALLFAPGAVALLGGASLWLWDQRSRSPSWHGLGDTSRLVGGKLPSFSLSGLAGGGGFSSRDVAAAGRPVLLNFFASWCEPCRREMPELAALARRGLAVWGIAFQDRPADAAGFLHRVDDPYQFVGCDPEGRAGDAFKLIGVPESFLVDPGGIVRWSWAGQLEPDVVRRQLAPLLAG